MAKIIELILVEEKEKEKVLQKTQLESVANYSLKKGLW